MIGVSDKIDEKLGKGISPTEKTFLEWWVKLTLMLSGFGLHTVEEDFDH